LLLAIIPFCRFTAAIPDAIFAEVKAFVFSIDILDISLFTIVSFTKVADGAIEIPAAILELKPTPTPAPVVEIL
jgi:hypothetical protein